MHLLVLPSWYRSSVRPLSGSFFSEQATAIASAGHKVGVIHPYLASAPDAARTLWGGLGHEHTEEAGLAVHRYTTLNVPRLRGLRRRRFVRLAGLLYDRYVDSEGEPDVLHAQSVAWGGVAAHAIAGRTGLPFVVTEHSSAVATEAVGSGFDYSLIQSAFDAAEAVTAVSAWVGDALSAYTEQPVAITPNGVDTRLFYPPTHPRQNTPFRFVVVAGLKPVKRIDVLLAAFAQAFARTEPVSLTVVGDGPERRRLETEASRLALGRQVRFEGARPRRDLPAILRECHCLVSSSSVETFGVTMIEALATGLPVVASETGGARDIVTDENGLLVAGRVEELAAAVRSVFEQREHWERMSPAIANDAKCRFDAPVAAAALIEILKNASRSKRNAQ